MIRTAIFLAEGFEEIEGLTVVDILRRCDIDITMVSITGRMEVTGSHGITVKAEAQIEDIDFCKYTYLILPGGMPGTKNLEACEILTKQLKDFAADGRHVAAICAAPSVLGHLGILQGKKACCYPSFEPQLTGAQISKNPAETDGNVITARGMGTAIDFALSIVTDIKGPKTAEEAARSIVYKE